MGGALQEDGCESTTERKEAMGAARELLGKDYEMEEIETCYHFIFTPAVITDFIRTLITAHEI